MSFANEKSQFLKKPDKSGIKGIDREIMPLINLINSKEDYFTTSSCSGRIILMPETGKKRENVFLFISHKAVSVKEIRDHLNTGQKHLTSPVYIKHEPCILHVACKNLDSAIKLVNLARQSGWKKSGIISIKPDKVMCELVSTEILAAPIAHNGKMIVNDSYLKLLVKEANKKLKLTRQKIRNLEKALKP